MGVEACREPAPDDQGDGSELVNVNWDKISADFLNHIRTPKQCAKKWEAIVRNKMRDDLKDLDSYQDTSNKTRERGLKSGIWTAADDEQPTMTNWSRLLLSTKARAEEARLTGAACASMSVVGAHMTSAVSASISNLAAAAPQQHSH